MIEKKWNPFISTFQGNRQKIHVLSVLGLTKQLVSASQPTVRGKLGQKLQSFTSTWLAAVLSNMYDQEVVSVIASDLVWQIKADLTHCLAKIVDSALLENVMELLKKREKGMYFAIPFPAPFFI